jgi:hypothetical protein
VSLICGVVASLIAMEMARKAEHEKSERTASPSDALSSMSDHATDVAVQSKTGAFPFSRSPYERRRVAELKAKQG